MSRKVRLWVRRVGRERLRGSAADVADCWGWLLGLVLMHCLEGPGRVYRRCGCRDEVTGRQFGARCERLADLGHGRWYFSLQVPGVDGGRGRVRRGGFAT